MAEQTTTHAVFDHAALHVSDLEASARFYEQVVGFARIPDPFYDGKHVWLRVGAQEELHLIADATERPARDIHVHLAFRVSRVAAFVAHLEGLHVEGLHVAYCGGAHLGQQTIGVRADGVHQIYFQDPDGYWLEVNDAKS